MSKEDNGPSTDPLRIDRHARTEMLTLQRNANPPNRMQAQRVAFAVSTLQLLPRSALSLARHLISTDLRFILTSRSQRGDLAAFPVRSPRLGMVQK